MNNPQVDKVYKSYIEAYHAAAILKRQDVGVGRIVRIEKFPYGDGYVLRPEPVILEALIPGLGVPGVVRGTKSASPGYNDKG